MNDADIRAALKRDIAFPGITIIDELGVKSGTTRVDVATVGASLCGYEIKSACDTLDRLPRQQKTYGLVFDRMALVVADVHYAAAVAMIPEWWAVIHATMGADGVVLTWHRSGERNPKINPVAVAELLWAAEAVALLDRYGAARGVRGKPRRFLHKRLAQTLPLDDLRREVRDAIRARGDWRQ